MITTVEQIMKLDGRNFLTAEYVLEKCQELMSAYLAELQDIGSVAPDYMDKPINAVNEAVAEASGAEGIPPVIPPWYQVHAEDWTECPDGYLRHRPVEDDRLMDWNPGDQS